MLAKNILLKCYFLRSIYILLILSCGENENSRIETISFKLKNGKEFTEKFEISNKIFYYPNLEHFVKILKEIINEDKKNINLPINNNGDPPLYHALLIIKNIKLTRYLLEQGANVNISQAYAPNFRPKPPKSDDTYNLETNICKFDPPLISASLGLKYCIKHKNLKDEQEEINLKILGICLLLTYGAKIKFKDNHGSDVLEFWPKEKEGKIFATSVIKELLKEENISKLDPDFITYAKECKVDNKILLKLETKQKRDEENVALKVIKK